MTSSRNSEHEVQTTLEENLEFLRQLPFFLKMPLETIRLYAYLCHRENYAAGEQIIHQGDPCDRMFMIMSGEVAICEHHKGRDFHLQMLSADSLKYFGELALLAQFEWFFSARAITDVALLSITREEFHKVMEKYPEQLPGTVSKIVQLRIQRFVDQTHYLIDHIKEDAWRECGIVEASGNKKE